MDADTVAVAELADVVGTFLVEDLPILVQTLKMLDERLRRLEIRTEQ